MANGPFGRIRLEMETTAKQPENRDICGQLGRNLKLFLAAAWIDILLLLILGGVTIAVWVLPGSPDRLLPITFFDSSGDIVYPELAYPYIKPPLNPTAVGALCAALPLSVILCAQIWVRELADATNAALGLFYALIVGTLFQVILKKSVGGLRPHFLAVCEPRFPLPSSSHGVGFQNLMFRVDQVCQGQRGRINNALESFPSGHAQIAFAGLGYLSIYLFAHLKTQRHGQKRLSTWSMALVLAPIVFASYISGSLVTSYNHHAYDVIAGGMIGCMVASSAYWLVFEGRRHETPCDMSQKRSRMSVED